MCHEAKTHSDQPHDKNTTQEGNVCILAMCNIPWAFQHRHKAHGNVPLRKTQVVPLNSFIEQRWIFHFRICNLIQDRITRRVSHHLSIINMLFATSENDLSFDSSEMYLSFSTLKYTTCTWEYFTTHFLSLLASHISMILNKNVIAKGFLQTPIMKICSQSSLNICVKYVS